MKPNMDAMRIKPTNHIIMNTMTLSPSCILPGREKGIAVSVLFSAMLITPAVLGQQRLVDERDQAQGWYLPVHGQVLVDGKKSNACEIKVYRDNAEIGQTEIDKKGRFTIPLDIDQTYTIRITKDGYHEKYMLVDTSLPKDLVSYPDYELFVNLLPAKARNIDPFYADFPSVIIRYDEEMGGFYHSEHYHTHIQTKLEGFASTTF